MKPKIQTLGYGYKRKKADVTQKLMKARNRISFRHSGGTETQLVS